jgi:hypothetical protein
MCLKQDEFWLKFEFLNLLQVFISTIIQSTNNITSRMFS